MPVVILGEKRHPDPPPVEVDALRLMTVGTILWGLATVTVSILHGSDHVGSRWLQVCLCGLAIGIIGMAWGAAHEWRKRQGRGPMVPYESRDGARSGADTRALANESPAPTDNPDPAHRTRRTDRADHPGRHRR